jgi:hypothetical protein
MQLKRLFIPAAAITGLCLGTLVRLEWQRYQEIRFQMSPDQYSATWRDAPPGPNALALRR